jgi:signal transduction histidine kinase
VETDVPASLPDAYLDRDRIASAIRHLVRNAFKYSPEGGTVRVAAAAEDGRLRVSVADEGIGIAEEDCERVFQPFTQADMSSTRDFGGVGLGLYSARRIVEAHGGRIEVASKPGKGSTFTIDLPLA